MNSIPAQEIKRRGISALDELLKDGPVHVIRNNRPKYVVLLEEDFARLVERRPVWDWLDRPARGTRTRKEIDAELRIGRDAWRSSR